MYLNLRIHVIIKLFLDSDIFQVIKYLINFFLGQNLQDDKEQQKLLNGKFFFSKIVKFIWWHAIFIDLSDLYVNLSEKYRHLYTHDYKLKLSFTKLSVIIMTEKLT